jgi:hypothetical protein
MNFAGPTIDSKSCPACRPHWSAPDSSRRLDHGLLQSIRRRIGDIRLIHLGQHTVDVKSRRGSVIGTISQYSDLLSAVLDDFSGDKPVVIGRLGLLRHVNNRRQIEIILHGGCISAIDQLVMRIVDVMSDFMAQNADKHKWIELIVGRISIFSELNISPVGIPIDPRPILNSFDYTQLVSGAVAARENRLRSMTYRMGL